MSPAAAGPPAAGPPDLGDAPAPLRRTDTFRQAARAAMWPQVARMLEVEPALRDPSATDGLKRYRVATRRLRAAFRVFDGALPKRAARDVAGDLAELARAVGRVRDLDVRIGALPADDGLQPLRDAWAAQRAGAAALMEHRLGTRRHARLLEALAALVRADDGAAPTPRGRAVRDRAGSAVWVSFERVRAAADALDGTDLEAAHDLRIRAKRLRYTLEFLAPVLGADREWIVARLVALQDHLGALNDAGLAAAAAQEFLDNAPSSLTKHQRAAIEAYAAAQRAQAARLLRGVPKAVKPILAAAFAGRLARAILGPEVDTAP